MEEPQGLALTDLTDLAEPEGLLGEQLEDQRQVEQPLALRNR